MSIDFESLLEFEDSLQRSDPKDISLTLHNLAMKIEYNMPVLSSEQSSSQYNIDQLFEAYDYNHDDFTTCDKCHQSISKLNECCQKFIAESKISGLEINYWLSFLNNATRTINTFPNYSQFLFAQQGIPYQIRSIIWQKLFLINYNNEIPETSLLVYKNFQHSYSTETSDQISKDLNRTFPTVNFFHIHSNIKELEIILNVYANYDVELGYCQGLLFLVGSLYYQFKNPQLTFHALITIMESEVELHNIFTQDLMCITLNKWFEEFIAIFSQTDSELCTHLTRLVDMKVFLFQWWLSFMSSHSPEFSIINRVMDFCLLQGWKFGMFKISLGLLLTNKPILMTLNAEGEEVIYQHLLNECKWGLAIKDINWFFGELLYSFDSDLFLNLDKPRKLTPNNSTSSCSADNNKPMKTHRRTQSSMGDKFKSLNISNHSLPASNISIFSKKHDNGNGNYNNELDSIYSDVTVESSMSGNSNSKFMDYLKLPSFSRSTSPKPNNTANEESDLIKQNKFMKQLLMKCMNNIEDETLKLEISQTLHQEISDI